ncbi:hypothetical protein NE619_16975 [Anaerovorax odorimutans]|uniref:DUF1700 domain-containing protein n=1 Tax=Anaerovorax odorimutans TaxID=109327 RepID=A0ABT1RUB0_9FIRM|nr:hypothetical protein [Anaerovorax odorimutans]MCQ4638426.1 hypothetical protein [Anaerovorax odorimutans]
MDQVQIIDEYIEAVRQALYKLTPSEEFLNALREDLTEFLLHYPDCTFDDLVRQFGSPEIVASDFLENTMDISPQKLAHKKRIRIIIIVSLLVLLAGVIIYCIQISMQTQSIATDVIIVENESTPEETNE